MEKVRITSGRSYIPKEIRETYLIFIGFWASYIFGNTFYQSISNQKDVLLFAIIGIVIVFFGITISGYFDTLGARYGTFMYYLLALLIWVDVCFALNLALNNLAFDQTSRFNKYHVWLGVIIYACRIASTELIALTRYISYSKMNKKYGGLNS